MSYTEPIDATDYGFGDWIRFAFDHPVSEPAWYHTEEMYFICLPERVIVHYARLFRDAVSTLSPYDDAQVEQGLWFAVGSQLSEWVWDEDVPLPLRLDVIDAMPAMFRDFLTGRPLDTACFMWWDMLRTFGDAPDQRITDAMIRALERVLELSARHCQLSALHGLGHLTHDSKDAIIRRFLAAHPDVDDELRQYALEAIAGNVL
jgi:hypothetical protein